MSHRDEIGLPRGTVRIVPYSPRWAEYFLEEKTLLLEILRGEALDIRHIGSTSIVGMPAKPILDILVGVERLATVEAFAEDLNRIGYQDKGDGGEPGRRYFVKGAEDKRTHHLNFCEQNGLFWMRHIFFRDYLEEHPDTAKRYRDLKRALATKFPHDRNAYTNGKEEFVCSILKAGNQQANVEKDK